MPIVVSMGTTHATKSAVGKRIAAARRRAGLTQVQLAERLGVSQQAITFWECQAPAPRAEMLGKLADELDVSIDDLLGVSTSGRKGPASRLDKLVAELAAQPRRKRDKILDVVETMLKG